MSDIEDGYVDEETLADYDEEFEGREIAPTGIVRSKPPFPTFGPGDGRSWAEYFQQELRGGKAKQAIPPKRTLVLCADLTPSESGIGSSPKKVLALLREAGWPRVEMQWSLVVISDEYYADDSKKKPGAEAPEHRRGDLKKPAHVARHWWLYADHPAYQMGIRAHWTEGRTAKGGRSFLFQSVQIADPIGMPTEYFADYSVDANAKKRRKDEPGHIYEGRIALLEAAARRRDHEYNDGASWLNTRVMLTAFGEFEAWLAEAVELTAPAEGEAA